MVKALLFIFLLLFAGCGYKPSSQYAREILGEKVYANVDIYVADPENALLIKDAIFQALLSRFRVSIVKESQAQTTLNVVLSGLSFNAIEFDRNGFVVAQRATITLTIKRIRNNEQKEYTVSGNFDFSIQPNGLISDTERFKAIREASLKAIDGFVTKLSVEGSLL